MCFCFAEVNMEKLTSALLVVFLLEEMFLSSAYGLVVSGHKHGRSLIPDVRPSTFEEMENVPLKVRNNRRKAVNDKYDTVKNSQTSPKFFNAGFYGPPKH